jgi:hypothetical protein
MVRTDNCAIMPTPCIGKKERISARESRRYITPHSSPLTRGELATYRTLGLTAYSTVGLYELFICARMPKTKMISMGISAYSTAPGAKGYRI